MSIRTSQLGPLESARMSTGIHGMDTMIGGGVLAGDSTLVAGSPGTGKTTMGLQFLAAGVRAKEPGVFVSFEYLPQQIYRDAETKGWPVRAWEEAGLYRLVCTSPEVLLSEGGEGLSILDENLREVQAKRLVIDSTSQFEMYEGGPAKLRHELVGLMNHLRLQGITTFLTHEITQIVGPTVTVSSWGLEFLVDNVVMLRYVELDGEMQKAMNILKFRGGDHDRKFRVLKTTSRGIFIEAPFDRVENISTGSARREMAERLSELV
ncbi:MAG: RAD55 family ATPase [Thermoplasmatota archaeon]